MAAAKRRIAELETELQATRRAIELVREVVALKWLIQQIHQRSRGIYSAWRVHAELRLGHHALGSHGAVELLMQRAELHALSGRPKWRCAKPDQIAVDRVDRAFARTGPNQLRVTDITEHPTREAKVYGCVALDT
ncbi:IS3 family transposase [Nonomuraea phyllanthi]|uniref:IS3 family transposase n=1 Tax=Nonomuraea phyllanthi TaxID=2219224 RepID=UPI001292DE80|nr:IS3 family transposase [Nonomuraea phyllanthi]QFY10219.1 IS3 family transposase [Nonomuraea phyllanthi]